MISSGAATELEEVCACSMEIEALLSQRVPIAGERSEEGCHRETHFIPGRDL